jgi:Regulator of chromosome condensation (RCC1) repeat/Putative Ig domain/Cutinase
MGYSQGSMVMHRALVDLADAGNTAILDRIIGVVLLADGDRQPHTRSHLVGNNAAPAAHGGPTRWAPSGKYNQQRDIPARVANRTWTHCEKGDLVCDSDSAGREAVDAILAGNRLTKFLLGLKAYLAAKKGIEIHKGTDYTDSPTTAGLANRLTRQIRTGPRIGFNTLPTATIGTPYNHQLKTIDNRGGQWAITSGDTPPIQFDGTTGRFSGAPFPDAAPGTYQFTLQFTDNIGHTATRRATVQLLASTSGGFDRTTVSVGAYHSCAIKSDATSWCWGDNYSGQLGDGTTINRPTPTQVGTDTDWTSISAGVSHTCGTKSDGTLWCWGANSDGQLGDGTTIDRPTPTQVGTDNNWAALTTGSFTCGTVRGREKVPTGGQLRSPLVAR